MGTLVCMLGQELLWSVHCWQSCLPGVTGQELFWRDGCQGGQVGWGGLHENVGVWHSVVVRRMESVRTGSQKHLAI